MKYIAQTNSGIVNVFFSMVLLLLTSQAAFAYEPGSKSAQINCVGSEKEVACILIDPQQRKLGYDFETDEGFEEWNGTASYAGIGCDDCGDEYVPEPEAFEMLFDFIVGEYTIKVSTEKEPTLFYLSGSFVDDDERKIGGIKATGFVERGAPVSFKIYLGDTGNEKSIVKVVSFAVLKQDIRLARKLERIRNDGIMTSLLKKAEAAEDAANRGQYKAAVNQLKALMSEVKAQTGKHLDERAATILTEDAEYLIKELEAK
ncbi:MAG: hypothetical protein OEV59_00960 [Deltaproteobacteria bacterium]|nr:hypothetical protein [Deltaproteobacteria bacterium]